MVEFRVISDNWTPATAALIRQLEGMSGAGSQAMAELRTRWAARYSTSMRRRFAANSAGGGDWAPLAVSTLKARRTGKAKKRKSSQFGRAKDGSTRLVLGVKAAILRDTSLLFNALQINSGGNKIDPIDGGVSFGFGQVPHPPGTMTIARLAAIHHGGTQHIPARPILVAPDPDTQRGMASDLAAFMDRITREAVASGPNAPGVAP